jgi:hypothetical protein
MNRQFVAIVLFVNATSCISTEQPAKSMKTEVVQRITHFYNADGIPGFSDTLKVWYKDSIAIEQVNRINIVTDTDKITRITNIPILYRYMDINKKMIYDYKSFSDTANVINKAVLPDSLMQDYGWSFYSEKTPRIKGIPEMMNDTTLNNITYKRAKFNFVWHDPTKHFIIGYFRCDGKGNLFSLEKSFSRQINCTLAKILDFKSGEANPFASKEVEFLSDTLSKEELKVFEAWERNARQNPVGK